MKPASSIDDFLDSRCSVEFTWRQLIEAGDTFKRLAPAPLAQLPAARESWANLASLAQLLDQVVAKFGRIEVTYGFAPPALTKFITHGIAPRLDQHAAAEVSAPGKLVCPRGGAAVDFIVAGRPMDEVVRWIIGNLSVDRLYFYGPSRPVHMSWHPRPARSFYFMKQGPSGRLIPKPLQLEEMTK